MTKKNSHLIISSPGCPPVTTMIAVTGIPTHFIITSITIVTVSMVLVVPIVLVSIRRRHRFRRVNIARKWEDRRCQGSGRIIIGGRLIHKISNLYIYGNSSIVKSGCVHIVPLWYFWDWLVCSRYTYYCNVVYYYYYHHLYKIHHYMMFLLIFLFVYFI
jgi:hypothetical protein